jgi:hypothetical protein
MKTIQDTTGSNPHSPRHKDKPPSQDLTLLPPGGGAAPLRGAPSSPASGPLLLLPPLAAAKSVVGQSLRSMAVAGASDGLYHGRWGAAPMISSGGGARR